VAKPGQTETRRHVSPSINQTQHGTSAAKIKARKAGFYQLEIYAISACSPRSTGAISYQ